MPTGSRSPYNETQIGEALTCFALASGSHKRCDEYMALRRLPETLTAKLVSQWARQSKREQYTKIQAAVEDHVDAQLAEMHFEMAGTMIDIERKAAAKLNDMLDNQELGAKETASVMKDASISSGIHTQRGRELRGKPTEVVRHDFADITRILEKEHNISISAGPSTKAIEVEAEEIPA